MWPPKFSSSQFVQGPCVQLGNNCQVNESLVLSQIIILQRTMLKRSKFQLFNSRQNKKLKWGLHSFYATVTPNDMLILCLNDSHINITAYVMCYWRTKNLDISLKVQSQHLVWYLCSSQAGISLEPVDLTAVLSSWNICSLKLYFLLFLPF